MSYRGRGGDGADESFDRYARMVSRALQAPVALVSLVESDRQVFSGLSGELPEPWRGRRQTPLSHSFCRYVVAERRPFVVSDAREDPRVRDSPAVSELGVVAYAGWPVTDSGGVVVGSLCAIDGVPRDWSSEDLATLEDLAAACSTELAHRELSHRSRVLLELSQALAETRTLGDVAAALEKVTTEQLDCLRAGIWLRDSDRVHASHRVSTSSTDPDDVEELTYVDPEGASWEAARVYSVHKLSRESPVGHAALRGRPVYYRSRAEQDRRFPGYTSRSRIGESRAFVPLGDAGRTHGVLVLLWEAVGDVPREHQRTIGALAAYTSQALQRALLHEERQHALVTLQSSHMPQLPQPDRLQLAARYRPAAQQAQIGGDWYDAVVMPSGLTSLMVGDVVGHDIAAAATMGQLRSTLRAFAWAIDDPPSANVTRLDRAMDDLGVTGLATLVYGRIEQDDDDLAAGRHQLRWTNAGHPPPLLVHPGGDVEWLQPAEPDLMLGLGGATERTDNRSTIPDGSTLLLYTDGLVERPGEDLGDGLARLADAARRHHEHPLEDFLDRVLADLLGPSLRDDVAALAVHFALP